MSEATQLSPDAEQPRRDGLTQGCAMAAVVVPLLSVGEIALLICALDIDFDSGISFLIVVLYPYLCIFQGIALGIALGTLVRRRDANRRPRAPEPAEPHLTRWFLLGGASSTVVALLVAWLF